MRKKAIYLKAFFNNPFLSHELCFESRKTLCTGYYAHKADMTYQDGSGRAAFQATLGMFCFR